MTIGGKDMSRKECLGYQERNNFEIQLKIYIKHEANNDGEA